MRVSNRCDRLHRLPNRGSAHPLSPRAEQAPAGCALAPEGFKVHEIAEKIGAKLELPVRSIAPEEAAADFGTFRPFADADLPASNASTRQQLGWEPTGPGMIVDLDVPCGGLTVEAARVRQRVFLRTPSVANRRRRLELDKPCAF